MIAKTLIAAAAVATLATAVSAPANAKVNVDLYVGGFDPGYYEPSYPVYDAPRRPRYNDYDYEPAPVYQRYGISCEEGRDYVRDSGFRKVRAINCGGKRFTYKARRDGNPYIVRVSRRNGEIISVQPAY